MSEEHLADPEPTERRRPRRQQGYIDLKIPYEDDFKARVFRHMHPNGATLELVGAVVGLTRERVRQIEAVALAHAAKICALHGIRKESMHFFAPDNTEAVLDYE